MYFHIRIYVNYLTYSSCIMSTSRNLTRSWRLEKSGDTPTHYSTILPTKHAGQALPRSMYIPGWEELQCPHGFSKQQLWDSRGGRYMPRDGGADETELLWGTPPSLSTPLFPPPGSSRRPCDVCTNNTFRTVQLYATTAWAQTARGADTCSLVPVKGTTARGTWYWVKTCWKSLVLYSNGNVVLTCT